MAATEWAARFEVEPTGPFTRPLLNFTRFLMLWLCPVLFCSVLFCSVLFCSVLFFFLWQPARAGSLVYTEAPPKAGLGPLSSLVTQPASRAGNQSASLRFSSAPFIRRRTEGGLSPRRGLLRSRAARSPSLNP